MDEPLVRYDGSGTSNKRWLHADERGSIIAHSNTSGSRIQTNSYDAFGVPAASNDGLFQYTGQVWLEDAGVYSYKNRTYHAELGVFMQTDPIGQSGGVNLYAYVSNDPVNFNDPWGLKQDPPDIITVIGQRIDPCARPGAICDPNELADFIRRFTQETLNEGIANVFGELQGIADEGLAAANQAVCDGIANALAAQISAGLSGSTLKSAMSDISNALNSSGRGGTYGAIVDLDAIFLGGGTVSGTVFVDTINGTYGAIGSMGGGVGVSVGGAAGIYAAPGQGQPSGIGYVNTIEGALGPGGVPLSLDLAIHSNVDGSNDIDAYTLSIGAGLGDLSPVTLNASQNATLTVTCRF